jgi:hypothetical protein
MLDPQWHTQMSSIATRLLTRAGMGHVDLATHGCSQIWKLRAWLFNRSPTVCHGSLSDTPKTTWVSVLLGNSEFGIFIFDVVLIAGGRRFTFRRGWTGRERFIRLPMPSGHGIWGQLESTFQGSRGARLAKALCSKGCYYIYLGNMHLEDCVWTLRLHSSWRGWSTVTWAAGNGHWLNSSVFLATLHETTVLPVKACEARMEILRQYHQTSLVNWQTH